MFSHNNKITALSTAILLAIILFTGCSIENGKIPITTNSQEAKELYVKGLSLNDRLRGQEAVAYFEDAIALDSNFAMAYIGLAYAQDIVSQVYPLLQKANSLKGHVSQGERLWIEANEAQAKNQIEEVRKLLKELITLYPDDERTHNFMASTYFQTQEYKESIEHYLDALEINPKYSIVYNQLGYAYRHLQNYNEAEKMFEKYIELIPNDPNPYDSYGELLMKIGKFDKSIANYEKALQINPSFTFSYLGIASNLNYKNEHVNARNSLQALLTRAQNDSQRRIAYNGIIVSYIDEGNLTAALKVTEKMRQLAINASDSNTITDENITLGILYLEMNKLSEAENMFQKSLQLAQKSNFPEQIKFNIKKGILANIALVDIKRGNFENTRKIAENFFAYATDQNNPNLVRFANQLFGIIALEEKEYESAIEFLRKSNQNNPYNMFRIALAYESLGDTERAKSYFSKAANANLVSNRNYSYIRKKAIEKMLP